MKNGPVLSGIAGGICFATPYCLLSGPLGVPIALSVSIISGVLGYGAGILVFSDNKSKEYVIDLEHENITDILIKAKKMSSEIMGMVNRVEDEDLKNDIREIYRTSKKIIDTIEKNPQKIKYVSTFFNYYLPETLKLLNKYDEIENQRLGKSSEEYMKKAREMISKIKHAFNDQLAHLYQEDMIDSDASMKVFDSMIKSEGLENNDFKL